MESKSKGVPDLKLLKKIVELLDDKKAKDVTVLDVKSVCGIADYFVIASGGSGVQVKALCDHLEDELAKDGLSPTHKEGYSGANWILLEFSGVLVHIFTGETREFYKLERLWQDSPIVDMESEG